MASDLCKIFKQNRPDLSQGSLRTYCSIIKNLGLQIDLPITKPEDVIKHYKKIEEHLEEVAPSVRKTRLSALIVFIDKTKGAEEAIECFRDQMMSDGKKSDEEALEQKLSERQKEGMMTWDEVMERYNELETEVEPLMKKSSLDKRQFQRVQLYVLLSCYVLIPPRRSLDYTEFRLRNVDPDKDNYYEFKTVGTGRAKKKVPEFIFNVYKTARKYSQQKEEVPEKLINIIQAWEKLNPHDYLLMNTTQKNKITPTQLTNLLYAFFDKPVSTSMLRHIFLTNKYKDINLKDMTETAAAMGHTVAEQMKYVKRA